MTDTTDRHDPTYKQGDGAAWASCTCGWYSGRYRGITGALLSHGEHLRDVAVPA